MKKITLFFAMALMCISSYAQFQGYPPLDTTALSQNIEYQQGNKYQKDVMLFVDMLTDTHPYYIKKERRDSLYATMPQVLRSCAECSSDAEFTKILYGVLGRLHDKHTDVIDQQTLIESQQRKAEQQATSPITQTGVMAYGNDLFHYQIFPEYSICYLQFNQCADSRTMQNESLPRWDVTIDKMFEQLKEGKIQTLVVDAQYNGGGSSMLCDELLIYLHPLAELKTFSTLLRFSDLMGTFNPRIAVAKKSWEEAGHIDELYPMSSGQIPEGFVQPELYEGNVIFIQSKKTYSSAGMLMTMVRDNKIGTIIGETSSFPPSHYGEILPYSLPNTGELGSVCTKMFARPDTEHLEDEALEPDIAIDLTNKEAVWNYIVNKYGVRDVKHPDVCTEEFVELMGVVARFADNSIFNGTYAPRYQSDIDQYFVSFKEHPAVKWISDHEYHKPFVMYDAIPWLGAHAVLKNGQFEIIPNCDKSYKRWPSKYVKEFLPLLADFYNESNFHLFYIDHEKNYTQAVEVFRRNAANYIDLDWFEDFYGSQKTRSQVTYSDDVEFGIIISLNNGPGNFGIRRQKPGQKKEVLSSMLYAERKDGTPNYHINSDEVLLLVHEFSHSYLTSPKEYKNVGKRLLDENREKLASVGYGIWENVIEETLVRISVIKYMVDHGYSEDLVRKQIDAEHDFYGFTWIPGDIEWYKGDVLSIFDNM